jgi:hypothetical protein
MLDWLPGAEQVPSGHSGGGTYVDGPWRFVIHTVEGNPATVAGCKAAAATNPYPPHLWYSPSLDWLGQTVPLSRSAFALEHPDGTPETNKLHAIQLEVFGYAAGTPSWPDSSLDGIADVIRRVVDAGYPINTARFAATTGPDGAGVNGKVRMLPDEWATYDGICCHSNVPNNVHWDAGRINLAYISEQASPAAATAAPSGSEDTTMALVTAPGRVDLFVIGTDRGIYQSSAKDAAGLISSSWIRIGGDHDQGKTVAAAWTPDYKTLVLSVHGTDDHPYIAAWNGSVWSPFVPNIDGQLNPDPYSH